METQAETFRCSLIMRSFSPFAVIGKTLLSAQTCLLFLLFRETNGPVSPKDSQFTDFCFFVQIYLGLTGSGSATLKISACTVEQEAEENLDIHHIAPDGV